MDAADIKARKRARAAIDHFGAGFPEGRTFTAVYEQAKGLRDHAATLLEQLDRAEAQHDKDTDLVARAEEDSKLSLMTSIETGVRIRKIEARCSKAEDMCSKALELGKAAIMLHADPNNAELAALCEAHRDAYIRALGPSGDDEDKKRVAAEQDVDGEQ
jgi:hypothetical protein